MKSLDRSKDKKLQSVAKYLIQVALLAIVYHITARIGLKLAYVQANTSPVWPPTGIGLAALLLFGLRFWPGIAAGVLLGSLLTGAPILLSIGMALGNTLESLIGAFVLKKILDFHNSLDRVQDVAWLTVTAFFATMISATIGTSTLLLLGEAERQFFGEIWTTWWVGDLLGALVIAPILLVWLSPPQKAPDNRFFFEGSGLLILLSAVSWYVFSYEFPAGVLHQALIYVIFPFMIIAALRLHQRGATIFIGVASGVAIFGTINNLGPFSTGSVNDSLVLLQTFTGVLALTSLVLAAATMERQRAVNALSQRVNDLATLNDSSRKLLDNFHHGNTYQTICELAVKRLGFDVSWIETRDFSVRGVTQEGICGVPPAEIDNLRAYWESNITSVDLEKVCFKTIDEMPDSSNMQLALKSYAAFPLAVSGEKIGTIKLLSKDANFFTPERIQLTQSYVNLAAVAIQNTWLYNQVQQRNKQLHGLSQRLLKAQEEERLHLSRELHDESGQLLAALSVQLGLLEKAADKNALITERVVDLQKTANRLQENLHKLAIDLRPASLDHLGLVNALQQLTEEFSRQHSIHVGYETVGMENIRLPIEIETTLYRVVQEALTNIGLHAEATDVDVLLSKNKHSVVVIVEDNGIGFALPVPASEQHLGLFGMRERVEMLGGSFILESKLGEGTTVRAEVESHD